MRGHGPMQVPLNYVWSALRTTVAPNLSGKPSTSTPASLNATANEQTISPKTHTSKQQPSGGSGWGEGRGGKGYCAWQQAVQQHNSE